MTTDAILRFSQFHGTPNSARRLPGQLVDDLAAFQEQKSALKIQIKLIEEQEELVKAELVSHAKNLCVTTISGSGKEATVTHKSRWQFPLSKESPSDYEAMDAALRRSNFWGEVSCVNHSKLQACASHGGSPELQEIIRTYGRSTEVTEVRLKSLSERPSEWGSLDM